MTQNPKLPFPNPVLRVAFAGNRTLPDPLKPCLTQLSHVYGTCITALKAANPFHSRTTPRPIVRFISGLAEGWDHEAARCLEQFQPIEGLTIEFAGVSGCALDSYRASRDPAFLPIFDAWVDKCSYILELDEVFPATPNPAQEQRVYQAQSYALLRQADLLLAVDGFSKTGLPGGTKESVQQALQFGIPVLYLNTDTQHLHFLRPGDDFYRSLSESLSLGTLPDWETPMNLWLSRLLSPPVQPPKGGHGKHRPDVLERFFRVFPGNSACYFRVLPALAAFPDHQ
jgi:hypothetical protein